MKIIISPDKFKGSLAVHEVAKAIEKGLRAANKSISCLILPLADGGEGSLEVASQKLSGQWHNVMVNDPLFRKIEATYFLAENTAYIEMAKASGLMLLAEKERNCMLTSTFGTGELIKDAIEKGAKRINLFIGGSATNDAGIGMAAALGYQFFDAKNEVLKPIGANLCKINKIKNTDIGIENIKFRVICDVKNPLFGKNGAAFVYAAQKGANAEMIQDLDDGLKHFNEIILKTRGINLQNIEGSGAAGGLGGGAIAFLSAEIKSGIDFMMDLVGFEEQLRDADLVITGEGKLDKQTLQGKLIKGICQKAKEIPVWVVCGVNALTENEWEEIGIQKVISLVDENTSVENAMQNTSQLITEKIYKVFNNYGKM